MIGRLLGRRDTPAENPDVERLKAKLGIGGHAAAPASPDRRVAPKPVSASPRDFRRESRALLDELQRPGVPGAGRPRNGTG